MTAYERYEAARAQWQTAQGRAPVAVTVSPKTMRDVAECFTYAFRWPVEDSTPRCIAADTIDWYHGDVPDGEFRFE